MKFFTSFFFALILWLNVNATIGDTSQLQYPKVFFGMQFGGQALFTTHFEYRFVERGNFAINGDLGFGRAEYADDVDPSQKATRVIHFGPVFSWGKRLRIVGSVHPSFYFQSHYSFINMNGLFGVRYIPNWQEPWYFMASYTPRIYYAPKADNYIFSDIFISARVGWWFN